MTAGHQMWDFLKFSIIKGNVNPWKKWNIEILLLIIHEKPCIINSILQSVFISKCKECVFKNEHKYDPNPNPNLNL